jgi:ribonuclease HII
VCCILCRMKQKRDVVGIDEVGRGPLAGPVAVCAARVSLGALSRFSAIQESKQLTPKQREAWFTELTQEGSGVQYAVAMVNASVIDKMGIAPAIRLALRRAILEVAPDPKAVCVLLDGGLRAPEEYDVQETIIRGDAQETSIAIASVLAKVTRDRYMHKQALKYTSYGFETHMGYGTRIHIEAIVRDGLTPLHRRSFCRRIVGLDAPK